MQLHIASTLLPGLGLALQYQVKTSNFWWLWEYGHRWEAMSEVTTPCESYVQIT